MDRAIGGGHETRRSYDGAWRAVHDAACLVEMLSRTRRNLGAGTRNPRIFRRSLGVVGYYPCRGQRLSWEVKSADCRVFVEIAQDVGKLKGASEMVGQGFTGLGVKAEDPHRQPPDRARHPVAIEVERCPIGRADVARGIHFHTVDDGVEMFALQVVAAHCLVKVAKI
jgi:hypothetical protein